MIVAKTTAELQTALSGPRAGGRTIGFVPTMGALHDGHASLFQLARQATDYVVVSIFVNPAQFGPNEDLTRYPRPLEADLARCREERVDVVFLPSVEEIYPPHFCTYVNVEGLDRTLEGASRPGHFRGVATVVLKLFNMVRPTAAWFGQKDAQQVIVLQRMVRDLAVPVELHVGTTLRAPDGLALSSRNQYLDATQRRQAVVLYRALGDAQAKIAAGERDSARIRQALINCIRTADGAELDYAAVVDRETLEPLAVLDRPALLALAVRFGSTRLIDNALVSP